MSSFEALFTHLVLPPKLPGQQDADLDRLGQQLVDRLTNAVTTLAALESCPPSAKEALTDLEQSLRRCAKLNRGGPDQDSLLEAFSSIEVTPLIIYVVEQNAALLMRFDASGDAPAVIIEAFEASPMTEQVLAAENSLIWDFPGRATSIPLTTFHSTDFQKSFAEFLETASMNAFGIFMAKTWKAGQPVAETRDTASPAMITQLLMPFLDTVGHKTQVPLLRKRVRDDVNICDAELPWRRHPLWLILRVCVQRQLCLVMGDIAGRASYKIIIAVCLSQFLLECPDHLKPELTSLLRAKICRRLAKLELEKTQACEQSSMVIYEGLFDSARPMLQNILSLVQDRIDLVWNNFVAKTTRKIDYLPTKADAKDLSLSLPVSGHYLEDLLYRRPAQSMENPANPAIINVKDKDIQKIQKFNEEYCELADIEDEIQKDVSKFSVDDLRTTAIEAAMGLVTRIDEYIDKKDMYEGSAEHMSSFALHVFDLWVMLDKVSLRIDPLLKEYRPPFLPELLDVLQVQDRKGLVRLQAIQQYLHSRNSNSRRGDIFDQLNAADGYACHYFENNPILVELRARIKKDCNEARDDKEEEWKTLREEYEDYTQRRTGLSCVCHFDGPDGKQSKQDIRNCTRCFLDRRRAGVKIQGFEEFLPSNSDLSSEIVFEMQIPRWFQAYRNATWLIVKKLAYPTEVTKSYPPLYLRDFAPLQSYMTSHVVSRGLSLASRTKSSAQTHFTKLLRVRQCARNNVFAGHGPSFGLYDFDANIWVSDLGRDLLSLHHHCGVFIPPSIRDVIDPATVVGQGPSSYQLMANQRRVPQQVSLHEFSAYQRLLLGVSQRWMNILVELASSNLNLTSEVTTRLLGELAVQAGPSRDGHKILREATMVFEDPAFCDQLARQIKTRLESIQSNWRESNCMELLITLSERLYHATRSSPLENSQMTHPRRLSIRFAALELINSARRYTANWIRTLRQEVGRANNTRAVKSLTTYAFRAALLCRRTFRLTFGSVAIKEMEIFCAATIAVSEFIASDFEDENLKHLVVRDIQMAHKMSDRIHELCSTYPSALTSAVSDAIGLQDIDESLTTFGNWEDVGDGWYATRYTKKLALFEFRQVVQVNVIEGFLLVDHKPIGRLPSAIRESEEVKALFGDAYLRTVPSGMPFCTHQLVGLHDGSEIHFGVYRDEVIIRAITGYREGPRTVGKVLQYMPNKILFSNGRCDLPICLVQDRLHFLNLSDQCLEMRERNSIWKPHRAKDWKIDLRRRIGVRGKGRLTHLVDPYSGLAKRVAKLFDKFESAENIVVSQPSEGRLTVELPRLELLFFVNSRHLLQEPKIQMEVDSEQDPGTFRGLASMIVLKDVKTGKRSILTPLGTPTCKLYGPHVEVIVDTAGAAYALFELDPVLGRLTCVPEPTVIYTLAHLHALTSSPIRDPLTGRTGVDEAQRILLSGAAQPWCAYDQAAMALTRLKLIASLAPLREFYPSNLKRLQSCCFSSNNSVNSQQDIFERIANDLIRKSQLLVPFSTNTDTIPEAALLSHLRLRGETRRGALEPYVQDSHDQHDRDSFYRPRDTSEDSTAALNVAKVTTTALSRPARLELKNDLRTLLTQSPVGKQSLLGGFSETSQVPLLNALIEDGILEQWGQLTEFCRGLEADELFSLAFRLAVLAFDHTSETDFDLMQSFVAFARLDALKVISPPIYQTFVDFGASDSPDASVVEKMLQSAWPEYQEPPRRARHRNTETREAFQLRCEEEGKRLSRFLIGQWPAIKPTMEGWTPDNKALIDGEEAIEAIRPLWDRHQANRLLDHYIDQVQRVLDNFNLKPRRQAAGGLSVESASLELDTISEPISVPVYFATVPRTESVVPSLSQRLIRKRMTQSPTRLRDWSPVQYIEQKLQPNAVLTVPWKELKELESILKHFTSSPDVLRQNYGQDLVRSLDSMRKVCGMTVSSGWGLKEGARSVFELSRCIRAVDRKIEDHVRAITESLSSGDGRFQWLQEAGLWPGLDKLTLLQLLRSSARNQFGDGVKAALVRLGLLITLKQWLSRVKAAQGDGAEDKLQELLANVGHENWDPEDFPDWLLMEIDGGILFRPRQVTVARQIIKPDSNRNSLLQLMMGQGKTSCIVGMAATVLANKTQLVRLVVPKALLHTTAQVLQQRLGGLVGTAFRHIPFNRRTLTNTEMLRLYGYLHSETRRESGLLLTTVDHILSFKLSGQQRLLDDKMEEARIMLRFQEELTKGCRDIIDESDLSLGVKTQLIYPSGSQVAFDGAPIRWEVAETLLLSLDDHLPSIKKKFPRGLEVHRLQAGSSKGFPMLHFLQTEAEDELNRRLTDDICCGRFPFLRPAQSSQAASEARRQYIRQLLTEPDYRNVVQNSEGFDDALKMFSDKESAPKVLLLLRGLLLSRILLLCLRKRWNVTYGLNPCREPIAVPYEARGVPSPQAEFGHPDVSILLTILSFLYGGLSLSQFRQTLESVLHKSDDPAAEYDRFVSCANLPQYLRYFSTINSDDQGQVEELYSHLRFDRSAIMKYLNTFVFPMHAKSFESKLSASSWDVCLFPKFINSARTTGFSGTNDNKALLPMVIEQNDLPTLMHTNAETMSYLLRPANRDYQRLTDRNQRLNEQQLLARLAKQNIRILLDAGAFILEFSNEELARAWLEEDREAKAVVYFESGRPWVWHRSGKKLPLVATPFNNGITKDLLVFFDEAHCRGVDLKLHSEARAALTLAPGLVKDALLQAAMRLRALATSQSVVFMAPPEVDASLRDICKLPMSAKVHSGHVLKWALEQSAQASEQLVNLHIAQGTDFCRRIDAQWQNENFLADDTQRASLINAIKSRERQTIAQAYGPTTDIAKIHEDSLNSPSLQHFIKRLNQQREAIGEALGGHAIRSSALEEVEQEREVEFQVEEVRVVAKPVLFEPLEFTGLHAIIGQFVRTGKLEVSQPDATGRCSADGVMRLFDSLKATAIGHKFGVQGTASRLFCSTQFSRTVEKKQSKTADNFLRPVEWVLWSPSQETALVLIPEEAEIIIRMLMRMGNASRVHMLLYSTPVTKVMTHFSELKYYAMPALPEGSEFPMWLKTELGLFAGRLYFPFEECAMIESYLRHPDDSSAEELCMKPARCTFTRKPTAFLLEYLALRRQVQGFQQTPMGYMLQGRKLTADHAFFVDRVADVPEDSEIPQTSASSSNELSHDPDTSDDEDDDWAHGEEWECVDEEKCEMSGDDELCSRRDGEGFDESDRHEG